jgi:hypothetical protein
VDGGELDTLDLTALVDGLANDIHDTAIILVLCHALSEE